MVMLWLTRRSCDDDDLMVVEVGHVVYVLQIRQLEAVDNVFPGSILMSSVVCRFIDGVVEILPMLYL